MSTADADADADADANACILAFVPPAWLAALGLGFAALGGLGILLGQIRIARALQALPPAIRDKPLAPEQQLRTGSFVAVIAVAVAIYLAARELGEGRLGLYVCIAILLVNSAFAARHRVEWLHRVVGDPTLEHEHRRATTQQMYAAWLTWIGCAIWLLRG